MSKFIINGGQSLNGEIKVAGNKNAALPILAATLLTEELCKLSNVPDIRDVNSMLKILSSLGKKVDKDEKGDVLISGGITSSSLMNDYAGALRASVLCIGGLLVKYGEVELPPPGGCVIGRRRIDTHFEAVKEFGAQVEDSIDKYKLVLEKAQPANIFLTEASVTATENALILAAGTPGRTIIENAAAEPHVGDLANFLIKMGAKIEGLGSNILVIEGAPKLNGVEHKISSDFIEAGTFAIAAACTGGELTIYDAEEDYLKMTSFVLKNMGVNLSFPESNILHIKPSILKSNLSKIQVGLYPGFPTDLMSPAIVLATQSQGTTLCHDWMFESRMFFVDKLIVMGAEIVQCDPHRVLVTGPTKLRGQNLSSPDIRAGAALVIAALAAEGKSIINNAELVDRGYEKIVKRISSLGGDIIRVN